MNKFTIKQNQYLNKNIQCFVTITIIVPVQTKKILF